MYILLCKRSTDTNKHNYTGHSKCAIRFSKLINNHWKENTANQAWIEYKGMQIKITFWNIYVQRLASDISLSIFICVDHNTHTYTLCCIFNLDSKEIRSNDSNHATSIPNDVSNYINGHSECS